MAMVPGLIRLAPYALTVNICQYGVHATLYGVCDARSDCGYEGVGLGLAKAASESPN